jgi:hypothetical protein
MRVGDDELEVVLREADKCVENSLRVLIDAPAR